MGLVSDRAQENDEQLQVGHRGLVDDQQLAAQRIGLVARGALTGDPPQRRMHGARLQPAGLAHPHRRPARRGHEHDPGTAPRRAGGDRLDAGGLAGSRTAGDHRHAVGEGTVQRRSLFLGQAVVRIVGRVAESLGGRGAYEGMDPGGQLGLQLGGRGPVDPVALAHRLAARHQLGHHAGADRVTEQRPACGEHVLDRQAARAAALGFRERVHDRGPLSLAGCDRRTGGGGADARDPVGDREADPEYAGELIRVGGDQIVGPGAVVVVDAPRQVRQAVGSQQHVQPTRDPDRAPRRGGLARAISVQADLPECRLRVGVDDVKHLGRTQPRDQVGGAPGAHVLDPAQIPGQHLRVVGRQRAGLGDLDLASVAAVVDPVADDPRPLTLLEVDERSHERDRRAVGGGRVEHRPSGLLVGEAHVADGDRCVEAHVTTVEVPGAVDPPPVAPRRRNGSRVSESLLGSAGSAPSSPDPRLAARPSTRPRLPDS